MFDSALLWAIRAYSNIFILYKQVQNGGIENFLNIAIEFEKCSAAQNVCVNGSVNAPTHRVFAYEITGFHAKQVL